MLRCPVVSQSTGMARSTIYRRIQSGLFPKPVSLGGERVAWPASEVQAINSARISGKSDDEIKKIVTELEASRKPEGVVGGAL